MKLLGEAQAVGAAYHTSKGQIYAGRSEDLLIVPPMTKLRGKVQLIFTSPPFPLNRKKRYGNLQGEGYVEWLSSFAPLFREYLAPRGSVVVELGNAWVAGSPTMSTLPIKSLLRFLEAGRLHLCQEFICFNPARLPSPAQWVTVKRERVKDAFTRAWWMSPSKHPKADNRRVLTPYSRRMKDLLRRGTYNFGSRPSEHHIGTTSFLADNGGAIVPNVLIPIIGDDMLPDLLEVLPVSNTRARDPYLDFCKGHKITPHPARMPEKLAEFFIRFLTVEGDLVMDPFAGSNVTGLVADRLNRKWISIEADPKYVEASRSRFDHNKPSSVATNPRRLLRSAR